MANVKISQLPAATSPLDSTVEMPVVQGGVTKRAPVNTIGFLQTGTGAATRTVQAKLRDTVSVKDFGAVGDGVADDTAEIQACLNANAGKAIDLAGGNYIVSNITIPSGTVIKGPGTIRRLTAATGFMVLGDSSSSVHFDDVTFDGNNTGAAVQLVRFQGASNDLTIRDCSFVNSTDSGLGVSGTGARTIIRDCRFTSNANYGVAIDASGSHHVVSGCIARANGASGILVSADYVTVQGNKAIGNVTSVTSQAGILLLNCDYANVNDNQAIANGTGALFSHGIQLNTCANCILQGNIAIGNNGSGLDAFTSAGTVINGNQSLNNGLRGIEVDTGTSYSAVTGNVVKGNAEVGISIFNTIGATVVGNTVEGNGTLGTATNSLIGAANSPYGIALWGASNYGNFARVSDNMVTGNVGSGANGTGLYIHPSCIEVTLKDNTFTGNTTQATLVNANLAFAGSNNGLFFEANGASTIASGSTAIAVTFASPLSFTPTVADVTLTLLNQPTNTVDEVFASGMSNTGFAINCRNNPGAGGLTVAWNVRKEAF